MGLLMFQVFQHSVDCEGDVGSVDKLMWVQEELEVCLDVMWDQFLKALYNYRWLQSVWSCAVPQRLMDWDDGC